MSHESNIHELFDYRWLECRAGYCQLCSYAVLTKLCNRVETVVFNIMAVDFAITNYQNSVLFVSEEYSTITRLMFNY